MRRMFFSGRMAILAVACWLVFATTGLAASLFQVGTITSLLAGDYAGRERFASLARQGDFGLGTFENLDGEMVALDGRFYQIRHDGSVHVAAPAWTTPFAQVLFFKGTLDLGRLDGMDLPAITRTLTSRLPDPTRFYAIRVDGLFEAVTTRSVPAQSRPWPPLATAIKAQTTFPLRHLQGTIVGIYTPPGTASLSPEGWHFHFLAADRLHGGHLLAARTVVARAHGERADTLTVLFPENPTPHGAIPHPAAGTE